MNTANVSNAELIDSDFNPITDDLYEAIHTYFDKPVMMKVKNINGFSMYMCKIHCLLAKMSRFLIAFVPQDTVPIQQTFPLIELPWVSFQTRSLVEEHAYLKQHRYTPKRIGKINEAQITRTSKLQESSEYVCDTFPIKITLLHTRKRDTQYVDSGTLANALETFETIICIN